jgi:hypothetical protein
MVDENWEKVREIFDSALSRKPEERQKYVAEVCADHHSLLLEVQSLLASLDKANSFLEKPVIAGVAEIRENNGKRLEQGDRLNHYEIIEEIGAGGMGDVYLARDQKPERRVAIKIPNGQIEGTVSETFLRSTASAGLIM